MNRLFTLTSFVLVGFGLVAIFTGIVSLLLTPLVMGSVLVGLGGILLFLVRLEQRLAKALPSLDALAQTSGFLARKEGVRAATTESTYGPSSAEPSGAHVRPGSPGAVDAHGASGGGSSARA